MLGIGTRSHLPFPFQNFALRKLRRDSIASARWLNALYRDAAFPDPKPEKIAEKYVSINLKSNFCHFSLRFSKDSTGARARSATVENDKQTPVFGGAAGHVDSTAL